MHKSRVINNHHPLKWLIINMMKFTQIFSRKHERNDKDTTEDVLLLLYLLKKQGGKISDKSIFDAQIKLMKLVFLSEYQMAHSGIKGFNFFFNVFKHGPSSKEVLNLVDHLINRGLIDKKDKEFSLSESGNITINDFVKFSKENKFVFDVIDENTTKYGKPCTEKLIEIVYSMNIKPLYSDTIININDEVRNTNGNPGKRLLMKLDEEHTKQELDVSDEWVETVKILLNPAFSLK